MLQYLGPKRCQLIQFDELCKSQFFVCLCIVIVFLFVTNLNDKLAFGTLRVDDVIVNLEKNITVDVQNPNVQFGELNQIWFGYQTFGFRSFGSSIFFTKLASFINKIYIYKTVQLSEPNQPNACEVYQLNVRNLNQIIRSWFKIRTIRNLNDSTTERF